MIKTNNRLNDTERNRTIGNTAPSMLLRARRLTVVLLCMAAVVCSAAGVEESTAANGGGLSRMYNGSYDEGAVKHGIGAFTASEAKGISQIKNIKSDLTDAQKKLSTDLLQLHDSNFLPPGRNMGALEMQMKNSGQFQPAGMISTTVDGKVVGDMVYIYIYLNPPAGTDAIEPYVWNVTDRDEENHLAVAWVEVNDLETLASLNCVRTVRTVAPPMVMTGSVTTEGDAIHRTRDVRTTHAHNGSGLKVGIISDGVDFWTDARNSSNLPADLTVLRNSIGGDEGTAMLEIVHDMVPEADLYFHDYGDNCVGFNNAIDALVTEGCNVICDDIGWITQPFFEDGTVASHVESVLAANDDVIYVSSAGNAGYGHYQGDYYNQSNSTLHDFSHGGATGDYLYLWMQAGDSVRIVLQWNDQFGSSGNNYNLGLYSYNSSSYVATSVYPQDGNDDPVEFISYTVPTGTSTGDYAIVVNKRWGAEKTLEVFIYPRNGAQLYINNIDPADSIFGHAAVPGVIAAGAIDASDPGNDKIEPFSSQGPVTITYPSQVSRPKPDICGVNGVLISGAGGFGYWDGSNYRFYGTSAAAPHVAAIAAQLWGAFPEKTSGEIRTMMYNSAVDLGSAGHDNIYGYGMADALNAFELPTCTCGDICVNETGWWRDGGIFNLNTTPIQAAVDDATVGELICVSGGSYIENVNVDKELTLQGEGADVVNVTAAVPSDHVFKVTADYVNISGFNVTGATGGGKAGFCLSWADHCNISGNSISWNHHGIRLWNADDNNITCNWVHENAKGFFFCFCNGLHNSTGNNISCNNIFANIPYSFYNNQTADVTATNNWWGTNDNDTINASIYDWQDNQNKGNVIYLPKRSDPAPCAPVPELSTIALLAVGLLALVGYVRNGRKT